MTTSPPVPPPAEVSVHEGADSPPSFQPFSSPGPWQPHRAARVAAVVCGGEAGAVALGHPGWFRGQGSGSACGDGLPPRPHTEF
jgi:hypothetical protein